MLDFNLMKLSYSKRTGQVLPLAFCKGGSDNEQRYLAVELRLTDPACRVFNGSNLSCPFHIPKIKGSFHAGQYLVYI